MKKLFMILFLLFHISQFSQAMESDDEKSNVIFSCEYSIEDEYYDDFLEADEFKRDIDNIIENETLDLENFVIKNINLFLHDEEIPAFCLNINTEINQNFKTSSTPLIWNIFISQNLKRPTSKKESQQRRRFLNELKIKLSSFIQELIEMENSIRIMLAEKSDFTITIAIYTKISRSENLSIWDYCSIQ